jgi:hypothetical protein
MKNKNKFRKFNLKNLTNQIKPGIYELMSSPGNIIVVKITGPICYKNFHKYGNTYLLIFPGEVLFGNLGHIDLSNGSMLDDFNEISIVSDWLFRKLQVWKY